MAPDDRPTPEPSPEARAAIEEARNAKADINATQPYAARLGDQVRRLVAENELAAVVERTLRAAASRS